MLWSELAKLKVRVAVGGMWANTNTSRKSCLVLLTSLSEVQSSQSSHFPEATSPLDCNSVAHQAEGYRVETIDRCEGEVSGVTILPLPFMVSVLVQELYVTPWYWKGNMHWFPWTVLHSRMSRLPTGLQLNGEWIDERVGSLVSAYHRRGQRMQRIWELSWTFWVQWLTFHN